MAIDAGAREQIARSLGVGRHPMAFHVKESKVAAGDRKASVARVLEQGRTL
jgi:hypothetical protein